MQSIQENIIVDLILQNTKKIHLVEGLGGFEQIKDFALSINPVEAPLIWLVAQDYQNLSFLTVDPFLIFSQYQPEFGDNDLDILNIQSAEDMLVLCMANIIKKPTIGLTINLKAPLVINWVTGVGKQFIIINNQKYSMEHRLLPKKISEAA